MRGIMFAEEQFLRRKFGDAFDNGQKRERCDPTIKSFIKPSRVFL
jgi:hypothetical protein